MAFKSVVIMYKNKSTKLKWFENFILLRNFQWEIVNFNSVLTSFPFYLINKTILKNNDQHAILNNVADLQLK